MSAMTACQTVGETIGSTIGADDTEKWKEETKSNTFYDIIDSMFGGEEKIEIKRMVQVGVKDGMPVYEMATSDEEVQELEKKEKTPRKRKFVEPKTRVAQVEKEIINMKNDEYLEAVENIRLQKLGFNRKTGKHKDVEKLERQGKKAELVFNEQENTYSAVEVVEEVLADEEVIAQAMALELGSPEFDPDYYTKRSIISRQTSRAFNPEDNAGPKLYAPELAVDSRSRGAKGAVMLVWRKYPRKLQPTYEIEIIRDGKVYSVRQKWNVMHIMVYWNKDYLWRARVLDKELKPLTAFAQWKPLRVVRPEPVDNSLAKKKKKKRKNLKKKKKKLAKSKPKNKSGKKPINDRDAASLTEEMHIDFGGKQP